MKKTTLTLLMAGLAVVVTVGSAMGQTPVAPLKAMFRCPGGACSPSDAVRADGVLDNDYHFDGYDTICTTSKGKTTCQYEGAFINSDGGLDINLLAGGASPDRYLVFDFGTALGTAGQTACALPAVVSATKVDLRFNTGGVNGIEGMLDADVLANFPGSINFTPASSTGTGTVSNVLLKFGPIVSGTKTLRREGSAWILTSDATVEVSCSVIKNGKITVYNMGTRYVPFELTVTK